MQSIFSFGQDVVSGARCAKDSIAYCGRLASRVGLSPFTGICPVCNNLQPHGHENTLSRKRGFFDWDHDPDLLASRAEVSAVPSLELDDVPLNDVLKCRKKNGSGQFESICRYCRFLCNVMDAIFPDYAPDWQIGCDSLNRKVGLMICDGRPLVICCTSFDYDASWAHCRVDIEVYHEPGSPPHSADGVPTVGPALPKFSGAARPEALNFIQAAFSQCLSDHDHCRAIVPTSDFLPTRLLYIGDDEIRLCEKFPKHVAWAALSHCWGGSASLVLTQSKLELMCSSILLGDLPATFKDGIFVARKLGLEYIWIDSLCIVQDSKADWQTESARMGDVYRKAVIVISAAASPNSQVSFLSEREDCWKTCEVPFRKADGSIVPFLARRRQMLAVSLDQGLKEPPFTRSWATLRRIGPLYTRAWAFQEIFLATRSLHFTPGGLIFECKTHRCNEGSLPPFPSTMEGTLGQRTAEEKWRITVNAYTHRRLTYSKDRLPALSGIASMMQQQHGDEYLAGLWKRSLPHDLLWHVMPGGDGAPLTYRKYVAPSWSWASVDRGVVWNTFIDPKILITIKIAHCIPRGRNPHGEVGRGVIALEGRLLQCRIRRDKVQRAYFAYFVKSNGKRSEEKFFLPDGSLMCDVKASGNSGSSSDASENVVRRAHAKESSPWVDFDGPAWFLCVARTAWTNYDHVGLLINPSALPTGNANQTFERLGCISNLAKAWYDCGKEQIILLQ